MFIFICTGCSLSYVLAAHFHTVRCQPLSVVPKLDPYPNTHRYAVSCPLKDNIVWLEKPYPHRPLLFCASSSRFKYNSQELPWSTMNILTLTNYPPGTEPPSSSSPTPTTTFPTKWNTSASSHQPFSSSPPWLSPCPVRCASLRTATICVICMLMPK